MVARNDRGSEERSRFTGDERDSETGLDHTWFRQYSSRLGRWMHPDPAGLAAVGPSNPQSWNRYAYVLNNPLSFIDPLGLDCVDVVNPDGTISTTCTVTADGGGGSNPSGGGGGGAPHTPALDLPPEGGGGNTSGSGFHFQLFPSSLRLPGESRLACIDRVQKALLGDTGQSVLNNVTGASIVTSLFTQPLGATSAFAGNPAGKSVVGKLVQVGLDSGATDVATGYQFARGAAVVGKVAGVVTAIGAGIEFGFAISCR